MPLLPEGDWTTVYVAAPRSVRRDRAIGRGGTQRDVEQRMDRQAAEETWVQWAEEIIPTAVRSTTSTEPSMHSRIDSMRRRGERIVMIESRPFRVHADFEPAGDQPEAIALAGSNVAIASRHYWAYRVGQVGNRRMADRTGAASDARARPEQSAGGPTGQRVPPVLPGEPGRVLRLATTTITSRRRTSLRPTPTSRRSRLSTMRSIDSGTLRRQRCSPERTSSSWRRCRRSTVWALQNSTKGDCCG